jgi:predicted SnoaL-like aldol condensation-catalyzing enzyme
MFDLVFNLIVYLSIFYPLVQAGSTIPPCPPHPANYAEQLDNFYAFTDAVYANGNITAAFDEYVWVDYIQHNPNVAQGRDAAIPFLIAAVAGTKELEIVHLDFFNNTGYVHHYNFLINGGQTKTIDVYRMNGSCIVEHWDAIANLTTGEINPTPLSS